jgi:methyl-accepting chemotaxis protein
MQTYEDVTQQQVALKTWQDFLKIWETWQIEVEKFMEMSKQVDATHIQNPQKLALELEQQFGHYRTWAANTVKAVLEQTPITVNLDPEKSSFRQWLVSVDTTNEEVSKATGMLLNQLLDIFQAASNIADFLEIEEYELASEVYTGEVLPSIESIQVYVDNLMKPINQSMLYYEQMALHEQEVLEVLSVQTETLLNTLVEETKANVKETITNGQQLARKITLTLIGATIIACLLTLMLGLPITQNIIKPLDKAVQMIKALESGQLDNRLNLDRKDEIGVMAKSMDAFADNLKYEVLAAFKKLAAGDFTFEAKGLIKEPLAKANVALNELMDQIKNSGEQVFAGSSQISDSSQSLSQGATEQATSLEEISSSITEMAAQTQNSAENANQANELSNKTKEAAESGNQQMKELMDAMSEINDSGKNISKIIKVIDEIAFQTNLLALNAAVEAARAGKHGKGFAVVAEEVRNLAARSAKAAKETAELIEGSVDKTENGSEMANKTADALKEIVNSINEVTNLVNEIAISSNEQAQGISQINNGLGQIDQITQQNTANAEESAAAAEELSSQSQQLMDMLSHFKLKNELSVNHSNTFSQQQVRQPKIEQTKLAADDSTKNGHIPTISTAKTQQEETEATIDLDDNEFGKY